MSLNKTGPTITATDKNNINIPQKEDIQIDISKNAEARIRDAEVDDPIEEQGKLRNPNRKKSFKNGKMRKKFASNGGGATIKDVEISLNEDGSVSLAGKKCNSSDDGEMF